MVRTAKSAPYLGNVGFGRSVKDNEECKLENADDLVDAIKKDSEYRNVLCHGSWRPPDSKAASIPFFVNRKKEIFDLPLNADQLSQIRQHVRSLIFEVVDSVTLMGWQFPGGGPGKSIMEAGG